MSSEPTQEAHDAILAEIRARFDGLVVDQLVLVAGAPYRILSTADEPSGPELRLRLCSPSEVAEMRAQIVAQREREKAQAESRPRNRRERRAMVKNRQRAQRKSRGGGK